ncbi:MAG: hypothetical protein ACPGQL_11320, partial [Thermoplasmatota archaeon]
DWFEFSNDLALNSDLYMEASGTDGDQHIYFANLGSNTGESISWDDSQDRFEATDGLAIASALRAGCTSDGASTYNAFGTCGIAFPSSGDMDTSADVYAEFDLEVGGETYLSKRLYMEGHNGAGQDGDQTIYFYEDDVRGGEYIRWDDTQDAFFVSDRLNAVNNIIVGCSGVPDVGFNSLGVCTASGPQSGLITFSNDLYIGDDLEVASDTFLDGRLYMERAQSGTGSEADQYIYFYEDGFQSGEWLRWYDLGDRFEFSDSLEVGVSRLTVDGHVFLSGGHLYDVIIGNGVDTALDTDVEVGDGGLCLDNDGSCVPPPDGQINALQYNTGASDLAEVYPSNDVLLPGEVVALDAANPGGFKRATTGDAVLRVVSTEPGLLLGAPSGDKLVEAFGIIGDELSGHPELLPGTYPIALSGRVPVLVNLEGDTILPGDALTLSSVPGVAKKAADGEPVLGHALAAFDGVGDTVEVFVNGGLGNGSDGGAGQATVLAAENEALRAEVDDLRATLDLVLERLSALESP